MKLDYDDRFEELRRNWIKYPTSKPATTKHVVNT